MLSQQLGSSPEDMVADSRLPSAPTFTKMEPISRIPLWLHPQPSDLTSTGVRATAFAPVRADLLDSDYRNHPAVFAVDRSTPTTSSSEIGSMMAQSPSSSVTAEPGSTKNQETQMAQLRSMIDKQYETNVQLHHQLHTLSSNHQDLEHRYEMMLAELQKQSKANQMLVEQMEQERSAAQARLSEASTVCDEATMLDGHRRGIGRGTKQDEVDWKAQLTELKAEIDALKAIRDGSAAAQETRVVLHTGKDRNTALPASSGAAVSATENSTFVSNDELAGMHPRARAYLEAHGVHGVQIAGDRSILDEYVRNSVSEHEKGGSWGRGDRRTDHEFSTDNKPANRAQDAATYSASQSDFAALQQRYPSLYPEPPQNSANPFSGQHMPSTRLNSPWTPSPASFHGQAGPFPTSYAGPAAYSHFTGYPSFGGMPPPIYHTPHHMLSHPLTSRFAPPISAGGDHPSRW